jgi:hypothetical protein
MHNGYECPNGHAMPAVRVVNCPVCRAAVVYEPTAHGMALLRALYRAHAALDAEHGHTKETAADKQRWPGP